jgi:isopentenyl diphosphate isomerase/L-lactate dehydrogenase-like FMN-dependent dehydrogenase
MTLATLSTSSIEEAMAVATGPVWFQLSLLKDRAITASPVQRAEAAGCKAIVLTVDVPALGKRERDVRNRFALPNHLFTQHGGTRVPGAPIDQHAPKQRDAFIGRSVLAQRDLVVGAARVES